MPKISKTEEARLEEALSEVAEIRELAVSVASELRSAETAETLAQLKPCLLDAANELHETHKKLWALLDELKLKIKN